MPDKFDLLDFFEEESDSAIDSKMLQKKFDLPPDGASHWLRRLQNNGLVKLKPRSRDRCFVLTEKGRQRLQWLKKRKADDDWGL